jgi:predicted 2-oxoglutarate/Fe(II)-dependent dioxygenase YbiX
MKQQLKTQLKKQLQKQMKDHMKDQMKGQEAMPNSAAEQQRTENHVIGLFPTPMMRVPQLLSANQVTALIAQLAQIGGADRTNAKSPGLSHSAVLAPAESALLSNVAALILPKLADFGELMFGERQPWSISGMWVNVLEQGGQQAMHNHANCFVSGVLYLTSAHPSANTVFVKGGFGRDFAFSNNNSNTAQGPFNAEKWVAPDPQPGDLLLFPSYLLHEVPVNLGGQRISLAFNAIPARLDAWGYGVAFSN